MSAAAVSDLSTAARPRRALAAAPTGEPGPADPATSITVTVHIDLRDGQLPPAVLGLLESVRTLAGPDAVTVAAGPGTGPHGAALAGPGTRPGDAAPAAPIVDPPAGRTAGRAADPGGRTADPPAAGGIRPVVGRSADGHGADGRGTDGHGADGRAADLAAGWVARPRPRLLRTGAETAPGTPALRVYLASRMVVHAGMPVRLTRREYDLLVFLCEHPRRVFTRRQLMRQVWGHEMVGGERTVDVHVRRLRVKLGERGPLIATVRGVGYRLDDATQVALLGDPQ
jgi:hypothetical protein